MAGILNRTARVINNYTPPQVDAETFKGQGQLAFIWQDSLYNLDGNAA